jgi:DNA replication protein DnaC
VRSPHRLAPTRFQQGAEETPNLRLDKKRVETQASSAWIREIGTCLITGPWAIGKTHLAFAIGVDTVENGLPVAVYCLESPLHAMKTDKSMALPRACRSYRLRDLWKL